MKKIRLLKNAALLTGTGLLLRGLGMVLRVYMSSKVGGEGMGLYQLINSVYFLFVTLAQAGISVTVTRRCSEKLALHDGAGAYRVFKSAVRAALITGGAACAVLLFGGGAAARLWIADPRAGAALYALAPSLPFVSVSSVISAYFVAEKNVVHGCSAQIAEQLVRMCGAWAALMLLRGADPGVTLAAVCAASTLSEAVSCIWLRIAFARSHVRPKNAAGRYGRMIAAESAPVAGSRLLSSALHTAENMLVPSAAALFSGSRAEALSAFGDLKGMALPLLFFPSSFLNAMSTLLVPEVSDASVCGGGTARLVSRSTRITLAFSFMAAGAFFLFGDGLGQMIFHSARVGKYLRVLSFIVPFMYLDGICDGLLKGMGMQSRRLIHGCVDSGSRILLTAFLVPRYGMNGFLAVMIFSNVLSALLGYRLLIRKAGVKSGAASAFVRPAFCAALAGCATVLFSPKTVAGTVLFCLFYVCFGLAAQIIYKKIKNNKKISLFCYFAML